RAPYVVDRARAGPLPQDGEQQPDQHLRQARGLRPGGRDHPRPGGWAGRAERPREPAVTPEMTSSALIGTAVAGLAWLGGGVALLAAGRARLAAVLETGAGAAMLTGTVLSANGVDTPGWLAVVAAGGRLLQLGR